MSVAASQIRHHRNLRKMTLRDLSAASGISASQLSKIESGRARLTVDTALKLAGILQVPASKFLLEPAPQALARRTITRSNTGPHHHTQGMDLEVLCDGFKEKHNMFWRVDVTADTFEANGGWRQHPGQEFIYMLAGVLELHSRHYDPVTLVAGDSILFDADQPHAYVGQGGPASFLLMNSVPQAGSV